VFARRWRLSTSCADLCSDWGGWSLGFKSERTHSTSTAIVPRVLGADAVVDCVLSALRLSAGRNFNAIASTP
jgi:hypothetical protein